MKQRVLSLCLALALLLSMLPVQVFAATAPLSALSDAQKAAYAKVLEDAIAQYGICQQKPDADGYVSSVEWKYNRNNNSVTSFGVAYAKIIDLDLDGNPELYFYRADAGQRVDDEMDEVFHEIWTWDGKNAILGGAWDRIGWMGSGYTDYVDALGGTIQFATPYSGSMAIVMEPTSAAIVSEELPEAPQEALDVPEKSSRMPLILACMASGLAALGAGIWLLLKRKKHKRGGEMA